MWYSWSARGARRGKTARSSTPVHFRNVRWPGRNWHCNQRSKMITVADPAGLFFCPKGVCSLILLQKMRSEAQSRRLRLSAVIAVTLVCALGASAYALQDSTSNPAGKNSATTNPATTSSAHKSTAKSRTHATASKTSSRTHTASSKKRSRKKTARVRGQQKIDPQRAEAIQEALIREHYLTGTPTGEWNAESEAAMRRYQADNGWQSTVVPDSRALIKLGLGPSKDGLLNPESAMTTVPDTPKADPAPTTSHSAAPTSDPPAPAAAPPSTSPQSSATTQSSTSSPQ
jgi:Putative peptidoglycan binding domain